MTNQTPNDKPKLDPTALEAVLKYAIATLTPPDDVVCVVTGGLPREPFLVKRDEIHGTKDIDRFLSILRVLYKRRRDSFEKVAGKI